MQFTETIQACDLVIFGAKGDLARRKLLPSLYKLEKFKQIHINSRIIGVGRADWNKHHYTIVVRESLETYLKEKIDENIWKTLSSRLHFFNLDINHIEKFNCLSQMLHPKKNIIINYFAVPPSIFGTICKGLGLAKLNQKPSRVVMEKPLGNSLESSKIINNQVGEFFDESQIFRIDHYLGKETILNLLTLRFANSFFSYNWDNKIIDHIQITVAEDMGIENRWNYFDQTGQMRDMVQNHLLQILTIIAMSPPANLSADNIRDEKVKVLKSLRYIDDHNVRKNIVKGQYISGFIQGKKVPGYLEEYGANNRSSTETFISMRVDIDNWRWYGVPFYLRTGKRLPMKCSEVVIVFKNPVLNLFKDSWKSLSKNKLIIRLQPNEGIDIEILNKIPGLNHKHFLKNTKLNLNYSQVFNKSYLADAYERLLLEIMHGMQSLFVRRDEVEEAWKWIDSITSAWNQYKEKPKNYPSGSWGPEESIHMMKRDGRHWHNTCM